MAFNAPEHIRVGVHFTQPAVFAGEEVECVITFTNTAPTYNEQLQSAEAVSSAISERRRRISPYARAAQTHSRKNSQATINGPYSRRASLALSASTVVGHASGPDGGSDQRGRVRPAHGRSLSILSVGSDMSKVATSNRDLLTAARNPGRAHSTSSSVQSATRTGNGYKRGDGLSSPNSVQSPTTSGNGEPCFPTNSQSRRPGPGKRPSEVRKSSGVLRQDFHFPATAEADENNSPESAISPQSTASALQRKISSSHRPRPPEEPPPQSDSGVNPLSRLTSAASVSGTPRSSMDFYSMSNNSSETLASEIAPQRMFTRMLPQLVTHGRQQSRAPPVRAVSYGPETLMMGYAQIMGNFTVDGTLVNQAPFEEVKRKNVMGGHGSGGVIGVERSKRDSGLFGSLGWGSLGQSLNGLLGGDEQSTIKDVRASAKSRNIPLISTPPSILFVDLKLRPGETRRYKYSLIMPKGLPPSHKGRAMKITYHVVIGVQRPRLKGSSDQQVKSHEVPFRLFGSINDQGEPHGHELMTPYNILQDLAKTSALTGQDGSPKGAAESDLPDFLSYVDALLTTPASTSATGLLSPTENLPPFMRRKSSVGIEEPRTAKEAIDFAILRSNFRSQSRGEPDAGQQDLGSRFEIARSGMHVATVTLARPSFRLGETISFIVDLWNIKTDQPADIATRAMQVVLESSEKVDPAIALRSSSSIYRYTRKVHAYAAENTLFTRRVSLALPIPPAATPEYLTSGISLDWKIRIEFTTARTGQLSALARNAAASSGPASLGAMNMFEQVHRDENGTILQGVDRLKVETFEVSVPVRIYGAVLGGHGDGAGDVEGLVV